MALVALHRLYSTELQGLRLSLDCDPCAETKEDSSAGIAATRERTLVKPSWRFVSL